MRARRIVVRSSIALLAIVLALGAGELAARALAPAEPPIRFAQNVRMLEHVGREQSARTLEHDPELFWRLKPDLVVPESDWPLRGRISNAQGFREERTIPREKPPGEARILFLGDSCTFGTGLSIDEGYVQRTEALLRERHPDAAIECINAGVPGYTSYQGWRLLETHGFALDPDLVVIAFGWNEISLWDGRSDLAHHAAREASRPPRALEWSRLAELAFARRARDAGGEAASGEGEGGERTGTAADGRGDLRLSPEELRDVLARIGAACDARGVELLTLVWPIPQNFVQDPQGPPENRFEVQRVHREHGAARRLSPDGRPAVVDLVGVARELFATHALEDVFLDHVHGTALANDAFARAIADTLEAWISARLAQ